MSEESSKSLIPHYSVGALVLAAIAAIFLWPSEPEPVISVPAPKVEEPAIEPIVEKQTESIIPEVAEPEPEIIADPIPEPEPEPQPLDTSDGTVKTKLLGLSDYDAFARLLINEPGPGYIHFPMSLDEEYFKQLTAEKRKIKYVKGFKKHEWIKTRKRNEQLDLMVYNIAVLNIISFVVYPNLTTSQMLDSLQQNNIKQLHSPINNRRRKRQLNPGERIE